MKKKHAVWAAAALAVLAAASCKKDTEPVPYSIESQTNDLPETIPGAGGTYTLTARYGTGDTFTAWSYDLTVGTEKTSVSVESPEQTAFVIAIPANASVEERPVKLEIVAATTTVAYEGVQEPGLTAWLVSGFKGSDIPEQVSYNGGTFTLSFDTTVETRSEPVFEPFDITVAYDGVAGDPVHVEAAGDVQVGLDPNYTAEIRTITVSMNGEVVVTTKQDAALVLLEHDDPIPDTFPIYWAKGNLDVKDGRYIIAEKMSDPGAYFFTDSHYAIPSDGTSYGGTVYGPEAVEMSLDALPSEPGADPCALLDAGLRMPTYYELYNLAYLLDETKGWTTQDGIVGANYLTKNAFFLPISGLINKEGVIGYRNNNVAYWGLGSDYDGRQLMYVMSQGGEWDYAFIHYIQNKESAGVIRCVKDTAQPRLLSWKAEIPEDHRSFPITIQVEPGGMRAFEVSLEADDDDVQDVDFTSTVTEKTFAVKANDRKEARTWKIFVNHRFTGETFVQPGLKNYLNLLSVSPLSGPYEAFDVTVRVDTDLASFTATLQGSDGTSVSATGSSEKTTVVLSVPENTGAERTFTLAINGEATSQTVKQAGVPAPAGYSVVWSEGYLTVKDGAYAFAGPKERGLFFKWKSRYGVALAEPLAASTKFTGTVYGPEAVTAYAKLADVPDSDVDPCTLAAPAGTWRMPTVEEVKELVASGVDGIEAGTVNNALKWYRFHSGDEEVYVVNGGQLKPDGSGMLLPTSYLFWTSSVESDGKMDYFMLSQNLTSTSGKAGTGKIGTHPALQVRCVREK